MTQIYTRSSIGPGPNSLEPSVLAGERVVCLIRLVFVPVFLIFIGVYMLYSPFSLNPTFWMSAVAAGTAAAISAGILLAIRVGKAKMWMIVVSTASDLLLVSLVVWFTATNYPLHFSTSTATAILYVVVALSAVRQIPWLVVATGVATALSLLACAGYFYLTFVPSGTMYVEHEGSPVLGLHFLDEVTRGIILVTLAWLTAYVTKSLRDSKRRYQALFENAPDGILISSHGDNRGEVITVNNRLSRMLGIPKDGLVGKKASSILTGDQREVEKPQPFRQGARIIGLPSRIPRADGSNISVRTVTNRMELDGNKCSITSVRDVTQQVLLEEQLSRSQEMMAFGKLSGGLAHDLNNIMGGILGAASLSKRSARQMASPLGEKIQRNLNTISDCTEAAREVIGKLLDFSRGATFKPEPVDLVALQDNVASICRNTFGDNYRIETGCPEASKAMTMGDRKALTQALLNLCLNGKDAMQDGGTIEMRIARAVPTSRHVEFSPNTSSGGKYWHMEVKDSGAGISQKDIDSIFDPFFTTKSAGQGSGLGLAMVFSIAVQHGGFVDVESSPNIGSVLRIYLPELKEEHSE